ncbi:hippurate hydrolase [Pseudochelatococcus lubricantis]|uniref:Hippurate hydrolase n=1 Tax=Pseudochelatococcus lubricantis TaxID=1538102 RepID=A0ABX0UXB4_9HYPH|nr:M20 aminoacylase family protein [Pseudochelatococcus lubricantis]NIJ57587.1 hippurate hydrolase [Pseudochelatococcus lubricantis]
MEEISELVRRNAGEFIALRHDLHRHPELAFHEHRTSGIVADLLARWGYAVERNIGGTGVVGQLRRGNGPRSIGLRADMDALPIAEETGLPYASVNAGVMHACGHDGHTTMLLAAAKAIAERSRFEGTVNLIFQPAEEYGQPDSGAARMIAEGVFDKYPCDAIFGMHNMPGLPQGQLNFRDGAMMAASDNVIITIEGRGGHGAAPHKAADPVVATAAIVMALQTIVARNVDPLEMGVITVGVMQAGTADNVIPQTARLELTVRSFSAAVRDLLQERITALVKAQAASFGVEARVDYRRGYPALVNTAAETAFARRVGREVAGEAAGHAGIVEQTTPLTASEDFAFMLEQRPGSYIFIGNAGADATKDFALHSDRFDFNDANIVPGAVYWTALVEKYLEAASPA